jgi:hypothetical protein
MLLHQCEVHLLSNSLFTVIRLFDAIYSIYSELLTALVK